MSENDRAQTERATEGLIKVVTGRYGRVLGAGVDRVASAEGGVGVTLAAAGGDESVHGSHVLIAAGRRAVVDVVAVVVVVFGHATILPIADELGKIPK